MAYEPTPFDQYTTYGLQTAQNILEASRQNQSAYPTYVPSQGQSPTQMSYYSYTPTSPMARVNAPDYTASGGAYQGLMGGDYARLEQALRQPGEIAAGQAYQTGMNNLTNVMGGQGLYGSTIMGNQMNQGLLREYLDAMIKNASGATSKRYEMEQAELGKLNEFNLARELEQNKYNAQMFASKVAQEGDIFKANTSLSDQLNAYNAGKLSWDYQQDSAMRDWQNKSAYERYTYELAKQAYVNQMDEMMMNRALAIAGQGAPLSQSYLNYQIAQQQAQAAIDAANASANAATQAAMWGAGGSALGGLLGNKSLSEIGNTLKSWFS